jgi:tartrate dehydratase beta subunit/fumarate hydratase class I family protein
MAQHEITFPITDPAEILKLGAGDEVIVQGHIIGIRDRTQIRIFDQGMEPPMDLSGAFLLHTAPNVRKVGPGRYEKICIGTTTSARMVRFTEGLGAQYGVRAICGKGGFPDEAIEPMQRLGMVYFAIVGGAAALRVPVEVPRQGLRAADRRDRRARRLAVPRRPGPREVEAGGDLCPPLRTASSESPPAPASRVPWASRT